MTTVYGCSDDLVEIKGEINGEVGCYGTDDDEHNGVLLVFSDGTLLRVKYGKLNKGIWGIELVNAGTAFLEITQCSSEDDEVYSDIATFADGLKWAYAATGHWGKVR